VADSGKGGLDGVAGADALPVQGGKIEESHEVVAVFLQAERGFGVFSFVGFNEQIAGFCGILPGLGLPDAVQGLLGFWLRKLGQAIERECQIFCV